MQYTVKYREVIKVFCFGFFFKYTVQAFTQWRVCYNVNRRNCCSGVGEVFLPLGVFTCGNLVAWLSRLSQVPQDVVRVHIYQPTNEPQHRSWRQNQRKLLQLTKSLWAHLCWNKKRLICFFTSKIMKSPTLGTASHCTAVGNLQEMK